MTAGIIDYKYKKEKQGVDLETLFVTALTAFIGGIGIIAVFAVLTGADICQWSKKGMVGTYLLLSVLIWGGKSGHKSVTIFRLTEIYIISYNKDVLK